jgi:ATP diphosphatase
VSSASRLQSLVARLRAECPWDRAQTFASMRPYLLEECHEVLDALDGLAEEAPGAGGFPPPATPPGSHGAPSSGAGARLREELGDLLFQVYFLAQLAEEAGFADVDAVAEAVIDKMIERHPHVFGPDAGNASAADSSIAAWEARKAAKRASGSRVDGVPRSLPALLRAHRVGEKVAHVGFDWPDVRGVLDKIDEERRELDEALASGDAAAIRHEYGDLLLACASLGRFLGIPGEDALRAANARFEARFRFVEARAAEAGVALEAAGLERLEAWWQAAKRAGVDPEPT